MLGLGMVMTNPGLQSRPSGGGSPGPVLLSFSLTAGTLEGGVGYGNDTSGQFGEISREPMPGHTMLRFNIVPDTYSMVQFSGDISTGPYAGIFPIVAGTPFSGGTWTYQEGDDFSYLLLMGQLFDIADAGVYAITWGGL